MNKHDPVEGLKDFDFSEVKATLNNYEDFVQSAVWDDMQSVLDARISLYHVALESCSPEELPEVQGALRELRALRDFPINTIRMLKEESDEQEG